ncbi:unnamed protein product [Allacma fusca]|uniref:O-acyltransferase WSD1 C-terminal domain-containing protein n=1 Tax=Allacma fusca TaxID=39272 RepID=A0A8J2JMM4_9HEXA|nr:unnamed protein product [Allacma fusca]
MLLGIVVQGEITPGRISQLLQDRILNLKDSKGNLVYHRMKQTVGKAGPHTLIIFRVDHVYCDLYSLIGLFRVLFQTPLSMPIPSQKSRISSWRKWKSILTLPSELSKMLTGNKYGVAFSHVIVSTANGTIARALRNSGLEPPANLDADYVLPMPNHPGGFNAHMTQVKLEIPCNVKCAEERLHRTQDIFKSLEGSFLPLTNYHCFNILTLTPLPILKPILDGIYKSGHRYLLSNMSTSLTKEYADGLEMVDVFAIVSFSREIGLYVANWGLNNKLRFNFIIDKSVFGDEASAIKFASYFEEELKNL